MGKYILVGIGAMILTIIILRMIKKDNNSSVLSVDIKNLLKTKQFDKLTDTNEFIELIQTKEFSTLAKHYGKEKLAELI